MTVSQLTTVLTLVALTSSSIVKPPSNEGKNFELLILHNNDMHARFEQTSQLSGACTTLDREAGKCYGGFPRVAYVVKEARRKAASGEGPPVLYLNAGDTYTGTAWFTIYKWKIAAEFLNALEPDAVSLGNNEFEKGSTKMSPFIEHLSSPILSCNVIINSEEAKQKIQKSVVKNINGVKVGIIGYLKIDSNILDNTFNVEYIDEIVALNDEVTNLKIQGVQIIVALGHSTPEKDVEIAKEVEGIDIVIAGHTNMFYSNGSNAEANFENVLQPIVVTQKSGKKVPIVQSHSYSQYLGKILIAFDSEGELKLSQTEPLLLDTSIPQNAEISKMIIKYNNAETISAMEELIGTTVVVLDGNTCRTEECNLGNLVTDSIMYYYAIRYEGEHWTDAPIAVINGGSLSSILSPQNRPSPIRRSDLLNFIPESDNLVTITMNGVVLKQLLEHSVSDYKLDNNTGHFLQLSGIRVVYDLSKEPGSRIKSAVIRCWNCEIPEFFEIKEEALYKILMPSALANGEYGYSMLAGSQKQNLDYDAIATLTEYIQRRSPVYPDIAERVVLLNVPGSASKLLPASALLVLCLYSFL